jgi:predicted amidohydrolase
MKIATAAYHPEWHDTWETLAAKLDTWVADAAGQGAEVLVFPEYAGVEAALIRTPADMSPTAWVAALCDRFDAWTELHAALAKKHGVYIVAGGLLRQTARGPVNASAFCAPSGAAQVQEKLILIPYERDVMYLVPGEGLQIFETSLGKIGILICYDSEFPLLTRALVAAGADVILVPSCTEAPAGQTRVRQSCRARAIESQALVVQAPLVGTVPDCIIADTNTGRAGIFCPPDNGLPPDGIIAQGETDVPGWTIAEVDLTPISAVRATGQVGNFSHWPEQDHRVDTVTPVTLR